MDRLKTGIILLLLAALAGSVAWAATGGEAEVRITARQLDDGRVEFALQQRVDGEWGERILPRSRYFPASVGHNRWLNSTPMTVSVAEEEASEVADMRSGTDAYRIYLTAGVHLCTISVHSADADTYTSISIDGDDDVGGFESASGDGVWSGTVAFNARRGAGYATVSSSVVGFSRTQEPRWSVTCD